MQIILRLIATKHFLQRLVILVYFCPMNIKTYSLIAFLSVLLFTSSCNKDNEGLFNVPFQVDFTIPAGLNTFDTHYLIINDIPSTVANLINQNGIDKESIQSINPKEAIISSIFGNQTYDLFREISVEIFPSGGDPDRGFEAFYRDPVPANAGDDLGLIGTLINAKDILIEDRFSLRIRMEMRYIPQQFVESRLNFEFVVR